MQFDDTLAEDDTEMQKLVNRLSMVFTDEYTTEKMIVENEEYQVYAENLAAKAKLAEQKKAIEEQNKAIAEQSEKLAQKDKTIEEKDKTIEEQAKELEQMRMLLKSLGLSDKRI